MLGKLFRPKITTRWNSIEKDAVDEIIFLLSTFMQKFAKSGNEKCTTPCGITW
jgi:hypothetical protein